MLINQAAFKSFSFLSSNLKFIYSGLHRKNICLFSEQNGKDQPSDRYKYPYNFNRQQYKGYIKKVQKAQKTMDQIQSTSSISNIPRRKRRVYDRPKFDTDTSAYSAWRLYEIDDIKMKHWEHSLPVKAKLKLQPKWVVHAFGLGLLPHNHHRSVHREYVFEDNNLSRFLLYQFRNTTHFLANQIDYDYENQQHLRESMRKTKRLDPEIFWESQEYFQFRVNSTSYAQHMKFCKWIQQTIQAKKSQESYESFIDKKFGIAFSFNKKTDAEFYIPRTPFIVEVGPKHFQQPQKKVEKQKGKKQSKQKKQQKVEPKVVIAEIIPKPAVQLQRKLQQQFRRKEQNQQKIAEKEGK